MYNKLVEPVSRFFFLSMHSPVQTGTSHDLNTLFYRSPFTALSNAMTNFCQSIFILLKKKKNNKFV